MTKAVVCVLVIAAAWIARAQEPAFDVASVKVNPDDRGGGYRLFPPGEVTFTGSQLRIIVGVALDVPIPLQELRIVWPDRLEALSRAPRFDILAKGDPWHRTPEMLHTLLKERFGLQTHREVRTMPVYALTVKDPNRLKLRPVPYNCRQFVAGGGKKGDANSPRDGEREACFDLRTGVHASAGTIQEFIEQVAIRWTWGELPIIDATGLSGNFLWEVAGNIDDRDAVFHMLPAQTGLTLEQRTGPWEVIVIDHVQMPTPN